MKYMAANYRTSCLLLVFHTNYPPTHRRLTEAEENVENNGRTLGDVVEGRFVTVKGTGALRGHQRCKRVESRYSTRYTTYTLQGKVRMDRDIPET